LETSGGPALSLTLTTGLDAGLIFFIQLAFQTVGDRAWRGVVNDITKFLLPFPAVRLPMEVQVAFRVSHWVEVVPHVAALATILETRCSLFLLRQEKCR
jgi:hypothetical protein